MYSNAHVWHWVFSEYLYECTPSSSITTISPGSISRTSSAPIASKAQLSEVRIYPSSIFPSESGLIPWGSLAPISLFCDIITSAKEPLTADMASITALVRPFFALLAIRHAITSESIEVWNICPASSKSSLITSSFTKFPLWAIAIDPILDVVTIGWAFSIPLPPAVEYLTCPTAIWPCNFFKSSCLKASVISPNPLCTSIFSPLATAIPALSWPLCWSA